eukprot:3658086-Rhodomonas_salina.1
MTPGMVTTQQGVTEPNLGCAQLRVTVPSLTRRHGMRKGSWERLAHGEFLVSLQSQKAFPTLLWAGRTRMTGRLTILAASDDLGSRIGANTDRTQRCRSDWATWWDRQCRWRGWVSPSQSQLQNRDSIIKAMLDDVTRQRLALCTPGVVVSDPTPQ